MLAAIARVETNTKQSSAAQRARARHTAQGHGERWQQFDVRSHGKAQVPYLPECFLRPLFDLSQTARLPCLGNWEAMFGWNGDTTIIHPVDEAAEVERARKELEVKARAQLSGMVAISSTFNKQERGQGHGAHKDPKDVCAIVVYTVTGEATLTLSRHGNRAVLTQPLVAGSAYVLEGRGVTEFDHAISAPKNGGERVCLVIRYVREELLADLRAVAGARAHA